MKQRLWIIVLCCTITLITPAAGRDASEASVEELKKHGTAALTPASSADTDSVTIEIEAPTAGKDDVAAIETESSDSLTDIDDSLPPIERIPELTRFVEAAYPPEAMRAGIEGTVAMNLLVSDSGTVDSVAVVRSLSAAFDSSAVAAARRFRFTPAIADSQAVAVILLYEYRFTLDDVLEKTEKYINLSGHVVEQGTRTPLADAMVIVRFRDTTADTTLGVPFGAYIDKITSFGNQFLEGNCLATITDSLGAFSFYSLPACSIEVTIPIPGYEEFRQEEVITHNEAVEAIYRLRRASYSEYEIVVYGKKEEKEVSRRRLTLQEIKKVPGFGGDAVKVVQSLPGVARATFGSFQMTIRGSQNSSSKFYLDGVEIPVLFHYGLKSTYNSDALQKVDFYPGGWGTRYGGAIGGIIEITGRKAKNDRWHGYLDANFFDGSFLAEGPVGKKVSVLASGRRSFIGDLIGLAAKNSPTTLVMTTAPYYWDYIVRTDVDFSKKHHGYVTLFGVQDGFKLVVSDIRGGNENIDEAKNSAKTEVTFHMGMAGLHSEFNENLTNDFKYAVSRINNAVSTFGFFKMSTLTWQHCLRDQATLTFSPRFALNIGADLQFLPTDFSITAPQADGKFIHLDKNQWLFGTIGGYLNCEWRPIERLTFIPGLRYDLYPELNYNGAALPEFWNYGNEKNISRFSGEPAFRLTSRYQIAKQHVAKISAGSYSQSPQPEGQWIIENWGNPDLGASRAGQYSGGWEWQITDLISSDVQIYYNKQWHLPRFAGSEELLTTRETVLDNGKRRMWGAEFLLRHEQNDRFFGWLSYSLSRAEYWDIEERAWTLISKDQTHNLIAVGSWTLPRNWSAGFKLQFTTGDPRTPVTGSYYYENYRYYVALNGGANSTRLDPTLQLDLRVDKKFVFRNWMFSVYIDFFNIGYFLYKSPQVKFNNTVEPFNYAAGKENNRAAYQYSLPSIGIKGEF
ncbi:MAG: TonB family protein [Chitinispirillaceae bacterium]|nr:TonB family protein [Chitinispirillaceae bacterium]